MPHYLLKQPARHFADRALSTIVLTYAGFAALWILLSDQLLAILFSDPKTITTISTIKGWLFVAVTSTLLAILVRHYLNKLVATNSRLRTSNALLMAVEADLRQLNAQLDERVRERTEALQASTQELEATLAHLRQAQEKLVQSEKQAALSTIVVAVAHELNTPLGNCLTVASTMQDKTAGFRGQIAAGQLRRSYLDDYLNDAAGATDMLLRGLRRATKLVGDFKQVAAGHRDALRRTFRLNDAIDSVVSQHKSALAQSPYRLNVHASGDLAMDSFPAAIEEIIGNLVSNSLLHGFEGRDHGSIDIECSGEDGQVRIAYRDDGCGMPSEVSHHVFDPFLTARLGKGGSGLGMSICYNLATGILGGSITVSSAPGQGTAFTLVLPRRAPGANASHPTR